MESINVCSYGVKDAMRECIVEVILVLYGDKVIFLLYLTCQCFFFFQREKIFRFITAKCKISSWVIQILYKPCFFPVCTVCGGVFSPTNLPIFDSFISVSIISPACQAIKMTTFNEIMFSFKLALEYVMLWPCTFYKCAVFLLKRETGYIQFPPICFCFFLFFPLCGIICAPPIHIPAATKLMNRINGKAVEELVCSLIGPSVYFLGA